MKLNFVCIFCILGILISCTIAGAAEMKVASKPNVVAQPVMNIKDTMNKFVASEKLAICSLQSYATYLDKTPGNYVYFNLVSIQQDGKSNNYYGFLTHDKTANTLHGKGYLQDNTPSIELVLDIGTETGTISSLIVTDVQRVSFDCTNGIFYGKNDLSTRMYLMTLLKGYLG